MKILPVDIPPHKITVDIITIENRILSPLAGAFIDCAREIAKSLKDRAQPAWALIKVFLVDQVMAGPQGASS